MSGDSSMPVPGGGVDREARAAAPRPAKGEKRPWQRPKLKTLDVVQGTGTGTTPYPLYEPNQYTTTAS